MELLNSPFLLLFQLTFSKIVLLNEYELKEILRLFGRWHLLCQLYFIVYLRETVEIFC